LTVFPLLAELIAGTVVDAEVLAVELGEFAVEKTDPLLAHKAPELLIKGLIELERLIITVCRLKPTNSLVRTLLFIHFKNPFYPNHSNLALTYPKFF
jgi:hypothetical protein